jgi:membrane-bound lytic murein transglycosylase D
LARPRYNEPQPVWRNIMIPIVQWTGLGGLFVALAVLLAGEVRPPTVLGNRESRAAATAREGAYSLKALHDRLPPDAIELIQRNIKYFQTTGRRRLVDGLARGGRYLETYRRIFRERGMPEELAYLPLIESGFVETAVSPAQAVGMWQFIEETGRRYNLNRSDWSDKRLDPFQSAAAAANLLKHLYDAFQDWELALAAYNAGAGTIRWAVRVNHKAGLPTNFWALELPDETRNYVPTFLAAVLIAKNPPAYGFGEIRFHPELAYDHIKVSPGISLDFLAEEGGISSKALYELNPALIRGTIPPGDKPYLLRVPVGTRNDLPVRLTGVKTSPRDWVLYRVQFTDTVESLATRFRANPTSILKANRLVDEEELLLRNFVIIPL